MRFNYYVIGIVFILLTTIVVAEEQGVGCSEDWSCTEWSKCVNNNKTRVCTDINFCGTNIDTPDEFKSCTSEEVVKEDLVSSGNQGVNFIPTETQEPCVEQWSCSPWTDCKNGEQNRNCADLSECGTTSKKPGESQECVGSVVPVQEVIDISSNQEILGVSQDSNNSIWFYVGILLLGIGMIGLSYFVYLYYQAHKSQSGTQQNIKLTAQIKQYQSNLSDPITNYVQQMKVSGYTDEQIKNEMVKSGYSQQQVEMYLPRQNNQLKQYTKQMLDSGFSFEIVQDHLTHHGYDPNYVKEHLLEFMRLK